MPAYIYARNGSIGPALLCGPYPDRASADPDVQKARTRAEQIDPWAHFYEFGVCVFPDGPDRATLFGKRPDLSP